MSRGNKGQVVGEPKLIIKEWYRVKPEVDKEKELEEMFSAACLLSCSFPEVGLMLIYQGTEPKCWSNIDFSLATLCGHTLVQSNNPPVR